MTHTIQQHGWSLKQTVQRAYRRIPALVAASAVLAMLLSGCAAGGSTFPIAYQCTAPQNAYGCFTQITFNRSHMNPDNQPDIPGNPAYIYSDLLVVPLTCDTACQASGGTGNPPGVIYNSIWLVQQGTEFIQAGYTTTPSGMEYFLRYELPGVNNGQYTNVILGPAPAGDGGNTINYKYAVIAMGQLGENIPSWGSTGEWLVQIWPPYGPNTEGFLVDLGYSTFHPDTVAYGQVVYGTKGATAPLAFFSGNNILTTPFTTQNDQQFLTENGSLPTATQTLSHPTDASWLFQPTQSSSGGMFRVACC